MSLSREDILNAPDLERRTIEVPEWDGEIILQELNCANRELLESKFIRIKAEAETRNEITPDGVGAYQGLRALGLSMSICDESGKLLFTPDDIGQLGSKNYEVLDRLFEAVMDMSGMGVDAVDGAKKNFSETQLSDSGTS